MERRAKNWITTRRTFVYMAFALFCCLAPTNISQSPVADMQAGRRGQHCHRRGGPAEDGARWQQLPSPEDGFAQTLRVLIQQGPVIP
jgi:hypothetical protein